MTYRMIVGHELGETGDRALVQALQMAARSTAPAEVHVVHAVERGRAEKLETSAERLESASRSLHQRAEPLAHLLAPDVAVHLHVRFGDVAHVLQQVAVDYDADLVVVGTHERDGLVRVWHGSVSERVARSARLPVLVAHAKDLAGLEVTRRPDLPVAEPRAEHDDQIVSEVMITRPRVSHVSGLL